jgi:hypothetical protein
LSELLTLLIYLLIAGVVIYVVNIVVGMLSLPPQVKTIVLIIVGLVFLLWILRVLGIFVL